jgi:hypothetical protein
MSSSSNLEYIITHVFLPPKLPLEDDSDPKQDLALIEQFRAALRSFQARLPGRECWRWAAPILMLSKMLELRDKFGDILSEEVELSLEAMKGTGMRETSIARKMDVLILSTRRTRLSHPQPECGPHRPKITATILVRVLRTLPNNPSRYDDEGSAAAMFSWPGSCSRSGQAHRSLFPRGACTTPRRIRCQHARGGMACCRKSTLPDPRDSKLFTSEIHY